MWRSKLPSVVLMWNPSVKVALNSTSPGLGASCLSWSRLIRSGSSFFFAAGSALSGFRSLLLVLVDPHPLRQFLLFRGGVRLERFQFLLEPFDAPLILGGPAGRRGRLFAVFVIRPRDGRRCAEDGTRAETQG